jgi:hypothetical protein
MTRGTDDPADDGLPISVTISGGAGTPGQWRRDAVEIAAIGRRQWPYRVFAITVTGLAGAAWRDGGPPTPIVFDRAVLERVHGARPARLDDRGHGDFGPATAPVTTSPDPLLAVAGWACLGLVVLTVVGGLVTWFLLRRRRRREAGPVRPAYPVQGGWPPPPPGPWPVPSGHQGGQPGRPAGHAWPPPPGPPAGIAGSPWGAPGSQPGPHSPSGIAEPPPGPQPPTGTAGDPSAARIPCGRPRAVATDRFRRTVETFGGVAYGGVEPFGGPR